MSRNSPSIFPEIFVSTTAQSRLVHRAVAQGQLRKLASRLYTRNLTDDPEGIVKRHVWPIVAGHFPGALVADRTALELMPAADGSICIVANSSREQVLPGLIIRPRAGIGALGFVNSCVENPRCS